MLHLKDFISQIDFNQNLSCNYVWNFKKINRQDKALMGTLMGRVDGMSKNVCAMSIDGSAWKKYNYGEIR